MNKVGQIFVILILIMSVFFAAFSVMVYSTHRNWREEIMRTDAARPGYKLRLENAYKENQRLEAERSKFEVQAHDERVAKVQALAKAEAEYNRLLRQYQTDTKELAAK